MVKTELTDEALGNAARLVRESMLSSLREEEMSDHEFSEDFRESLLEEVRRNEQERARKRLVLRRCIAALLSVVVGLSLFFGLNTEARAAALHIDDERRQVGACHIGNAFCLQGNPRRRRRGHCSYAG